MSTEFQKGEVVRLKSGGPDMTVENVGEKGMTGENAVWCVWFDEKKQRQRDTFAPESLERTPPQRPMTRRLNRA